MIDCKLLCERRLIFGQFDKSNGSLTPGEDKYNRT